MAASRPPIRRSLWVKVRRDRVVTQTAEVPGTTQSVSVEDGAVSRAESVVVEQGCAALSGQAFARFAASLDEAPVTIPALIALFARPSPLP
jgi:uncharacterized protein (DUF1778 family)